MYFFLYKSDKNDEWYWILKNSISGEIIAAAADGYIDKEDAISEISLFKTAAVTAPIYDNSVEKCV